MSDRGRLFPLPCDPFGDDDLFDAAAADQARQDALRLETRETAELARQLLSSWPRDYSTPLEETLEEARAFLLTVGHCAAERVAGQNSDQRAEERDLVLKCAHARREFVLRRHAGESLTCSEGRA